MTSTHRPASWRLSPFEIENSGAYYTPIDLVDLTISQVLPDMLRERLVGVDDPLSKISEIRIMDPAVGTGAFTTRAAQILCRFVDLVGEGLAVEDAIAACWDDKGRCLVDKTDLMPWDKMGECLRWIVNNLIDGDKEDLNAKIANITDQLKKKPNPKKIREQIVDKNFDDIHSGALGEAGIEEKVQEEIVKQSRIEPGEYGNQYVKVSSLVIAHIETMSDNTTTGSCYLNSCATPTELLPLQYPDYKPTGMLIGQQKVAFLDRGEQVWGETDVTSRVLMSFPLIGRTHLNIDRQLVSI